MVVYIRSLWFVFVSTPILYLKAFIPISVYSLVYISISMSSKIQSYNCISVLFISHVYGCVIKFQLKSLTPCSWDRQPSPWSTWVSVEEDHIKRRRRPSPYHEKERVTLSYHDRRGVIRWTGRSGSVRRVQRRLIAAEYRSVRAGRCPRLDWLIIADAAVINPYIYVAYNQNDLLTSF